MLIKQTKDMTDSERIAAENSNNQYLKALSYAPVGMIVPFGGTVAPDTFLFCDGSALDTTEHSDLFGVIGYTYGGSGDTFNLPDLRGKTIIGMNATDDSFNVLGKTGGKKQHKHGLSKAYAIIGQITSGNTSNIAWKSSEYGYGSKAGLTSNTPLGIVGATNSIHPTALGGETDDQDNLQPYIVTNFIIKSVNAVSKDVEIMVKVQADQTYLPNSENAQSGKAVAEAVEQLMPKVLPHYGSEYDQVLVIKDIRYDENEELSYKYSTYPIDRQHEGTSGGLEEPDCIPIRNYNACLTTNYPSDKYDCTNKAYVDGMYKELLDRIVALESKI